MKSKIHESKKEKPESIRKTIADNSQLAWHLQNNVMPVLSQTTIDKILHSVSEFNTGKLKLRDKIFKDAPVSVGEMFEDLKIELE
jgi:hypothetical protein